jgi:hypothetical protein
MSFPTTATLPFRTLISLRPPRNAPKERTPPVRTVFAFDTVESAIAAMAHGEFVVVMDDESRENEGDLIIPAAGCSTEQMAWMIKYTRLVRRSIPDLPDLMIFHSAFRRTLLRLPTQRIHLYPTPR